MAVELPPTYVTDYPLPQGPIPSVGTPPGLPIGDPTEGKNLLKSARAIERRTRQEVLDQYPRKVQVIRDDIDAKLAKIRQSAVGGSELEKFNAIQAAEQVLLNTLTAQRDEKIATAHKWYATDPTLYNPAYTEPGFTDNMRDDYDYNQKVISWSAAYKYWWDARAIEQGMAIVSQDIAQVNNKIQAQQAALEQAREISQSIGSQLSLIASAEQVHLNTHLQALEIQFSESINQANSAYGAASPRVQETLQQAYGQIDSLTAEASSQVDAAELAQINQSMRAQAELIVAKFSAAANQQLADAKAFIDFQRNVINQASSNAAIQTSGQLMALTSKVQAAPSRDAAANAQQVFQQAVSDLYDPLNYQINVAAGAGITASERAINGISIAEQAAQRELRSLPYGTQVAISQAIVAQFSHITSAAQTHLNTHLQALEIQFSESVNQANAAYEAASPSVRETLRQTYKQIDSITSKAGNQVNATELDRINQSLRAQARSIAAEFSAVATQQIVDAKAFIDSQRQIINQASNNAATRADGQLATLTAQVQAAPSRDAAVNARQSLQQAVSGLYDPLNYQINVAAGAGITESERAINGTQAAQRAAQEQLQALSKTTQDAITKAANNYHFSANIGLSLTVPGQGVVPLAETAFSALLQSIRGAITALGEIALTAASGPSVVGIAALAYPRSTASEEQDQIPARYRYSMEINAGELGIAAGTNLNAIASTHGSVDLAYRLTNERRGDGRSHISVVAADGVNVSKSVPVRAATFDPQTGRYTLAVPSLVPDQPPITLTWTPTSPPGDSSSTSTTPAQPPVVPVYTGVELEPLNIKALTYPDTAPRPSDLIITYPADNGMEPVYVMFSSPYGETNAKGKYSGRDYNTEKAGGQILDLDWRTATVDQTGVDKVKLHTGRFGESVDNQVMIERLEKILKGELQITDTDKRFYTHEIRELERYRALGIADGAVPENAYEVWNNTHTASLEDYKLSSDETLLYTPEALN